MIATHLELADIKEVIASRMFYFHRRDVEIEKCNLRVPRWQQFLTELISE